MQNSYKIDDLDVKAIFSYLDTAYLSLLINNPACDLSDFRRWLVDNDSLLPKKEYSFLCQLGVKRSTFTPNLSEWLQQIKLRKVAVTHNWNRPFEQWVRYAGGLFEKSGGVFVEGDDETVLDNRRIQVALKTGAILFDVKKSQVENGSYVVEMFINRTSQLDKIGLSLNSAGIEGNFVRDKRERNHVVYAARDPNFSKVNIALKNAKLPYVSSIFLGPDE